jgi:hypothetical protein
LILVNKVNTNGGGALGSGGEGEASGDKYYVDVNEDGFLSPLDILWVVNRINGSNFSGEGEGQSQAVPSIESTNSEVAASSVNPPIEIQSNRLVRSGTPNWVINSVVDPSSVDDLLAGYSAEEDQEDNVSELVDDLFASDLI